jgi:hypothetical protein
MQLRAKFKAFRRQQFIIIFDQETPHTGTTIDADAPAVVAHCLQQHSSHRMLYHTHSGLWRELRHDGETFLQIVGIAADELEGILEKFGLQY